MKYCNSSTLDPQFSLTPGKRTTLLIKLGFNSGMLSTWLQVLFSCPQRIWFTSSACLVGVAKLCHLTDETIAFFNTLKCWFALVLNETLMEMKQGEISFWCWGGSNLLGELGDSDQCQTSYFSIHPWSTWNELLSCLPLRIYIRLCVPSNMFRVTLINPRFLLKYYKVHSLLFTPWELTLKIFFKLED